LDGTPIKIENIRNISRQFAFGSFEGGARVIVIEGAENMTIEASNALLKSLEEPPKDTYFLLSSSVASKLLPTIISRCQPVPLSPLSSAQVEELIAHQDRSTAQLTTASRFSGGSPGQALALLDDPVFNNRVTLYNRFFEAIAQSPPDLLGFADWTIAQASSIQITGTKLNKERELIFRSLNLLTVLLRDLMLLKTGATTAQLINIDILPILEELTVQLTLEELSSILREIDIARESTEGNVTPRLVLEALIANLSLDNRH
jgi:DNA polymerase-3 subunit delta'